MSSWSTHIFQHFLRSPYSLEFHQTFREIFSIADFFEKKRFIFLKAEWEQEQETTREISPLCSHPKWHHFLGLDQTEARSQEFHLAFHKDGRNLSHRLQLSWHIRRELKQKAENRGLKSAFRYRMGVLQIAVSLTHCTSFLFCFCFLPFTSYCSYRIDLIALWKKWL